ICTASRPPPRKPITDSTPSASTAAAGDQDQPSPSDARGSIGLKLLDAPRGREEDPRAHTYIVDHLAPGSVIHRRLLVTNTSDTDQRVDLYAASASVSSGTFNVDADRTPNELTTWVSVDGCVSEEDVSGKSTDCGTPDTRPTTTPTASPTTTPTTAPTTAPATASPTTAPATASPTTAPAGTARVVPAHGSAMVRVGIHVPAKASAGERYAVLWAQVASRAAGPTANVRLLNRVGVRIYLDVGPGGEPPSDFRIEELIPVRAPDGAPKVLAKVHNTGKRALDLTGSMSLTDGPGSLSAGPFPAKLGTTLGVDETEPVTVPLDRQLPDGPWQAHLTLASGLVKHTVTATITFPAGSGAGAPARPDAGGPETSGMVMGGSAAALVLALCGYRVLRRGSRS
ncbi:hypothetical protein, partial [Kitasatospora sp. NPDC097643]|uniref:hypothetical protein n=1 Tax=Kitasatospora sp. NPDC097643 TaxID=3157230 RepID=UPI0033225789